MTSLLTEYEQNNFFFLGGGGFFIFFPYYIQHCFICRPSDSTEPTDAGIEPRTVATGALTVRRFNHKARSNPLNARSQPHKARSHTHKARSHPHKARSHPHKARSHPQQNRTTFGFNWKRGMLACTDQNAQKNVYLILCMWGIKFTFQRQDCDHIEIIHPHLVILSTGGGGGFLFTRACILFIRKVTAYLLQEPSQEVNKFNFFFIIWVYDCIYQNAIARAI